MIKTVIFDLDGTLLDTLEDLCDSVNFVLRAHGYPERSLDEVRAFVGNGVRRLLERALPEDVSEEMADDCFDEFCEYYGEHSDMKTAPYDGVVDMLKALKRQGISVAVVSNKIDAAVKSLCRKYFGELVSVAVGDRADVPKKPDAALVNIAISELGCGESSCAVYVGDSDVDIETARNVGMDCICVTWGFRDRDLLEKQGGEIFADNTAQLLKIIEGM